MSNPVPKPPVASSMHPVQVRAAAISQLCVHPLEVAARLESEGFTDGDAGWAGYADLFELASATFELTAPGAAGPAVPQTLREQLSQARPNIRLLARGGLFAMPGLAMAAVVPANVPRHQALLVAMALAGAWAIGQATAYLAYQRTPAMRRRLLEQAVRRVSLAGLALAAALIMLDVFSFRVGVAAAVQTSVMISASALIVREREALLALTLLPGAIAALFVLTAGPSTTATAVAVVSLVATVPMALRRSTGEGVLVSAPVRRVEVGTASTHGVHGLLSAFFALWLPFAMVTSPAVGWSTAALVLSLGPAEYLLVGFRSWSRTRLAQYLDLGEFRRAVRAGLLVTLGCFAFAVSLMEALVAWLAIEVAAIEPRLAIAVSLGLGLLGLTYLAQGIAIALSGVVPVVIVSLAAGTSLVIDRLVTPAAPLLSFVAVLAALTCASAVVAVRQSLNPHVHT